MKWVIAGAVGLLILIIIGVVANAKYMVAHHCKPTGQTRFAFMQKIGDIYIPVNETQYRCDGDEIRWN
jgi:hypothetical protein